MFDVVDMNRHITEDLQQEIERDGIVIYEKETNENGSRFNMNFERFYNLYEQIKQMKEFSEFEKERYENNYILNEKPFDKNKANQQVIMLINKYGIELNTIAILSRNGKTTTKQDHAKTEIQIKSELDYINQCIPLIALIRTQISSELNEILNTTLNNNEVNGTGNFYG